MTDLIHGGVGILPQGDNTSVKVAPASQEAGHGRGGKDDGRIPPHGDNTPPKGVAPNRSERTGHNTPDNGVGPPDSYDCALSVQASNVCLLLMMSKQARLKTQKTQKSQKNFSEIFKSEFSILAAVQNQKLGNKKTRNISEMYEISEVPEFLIWHFFIFQKTFFSIFYSRQFHTFYVMFCFQSLLKCFFLHQKYMFKILPCHNEIYLF